MVVCPHSGKPPNLRERKVRASSISGIRNDQRCYCILCARLVPLVNGKFPNHNREMRGISL